MPHHCGTSGGCPQFSPQMPLLCTPSNFKLERHLKKCSINVCLSEFRGNITPPFFLFILTKSPVQAFHTFFSRKITISFFFLQRNNKVYRYRVRVVVLNLADLIFNNLYHQRSLPICCNAKMT